MSAQGKGAASGAVEFTHEAGPLAIEALHALPSPTQERVKAIVDLRLRKRTADPAALGFEPTAEELTMGEEFASAILDMMRAGFEAEKAAP